MKIFTPLLITYFTLISLTQIRAEEIELPPIVAVGTPGEVLVDDSMVPSRSGDTGISSGAGSIQNSLQNQLAVPITDYGRAGNAAQVRGFGFSAEDVDAQILGISVNPPQGGGFDLSIFPQYLWSGYRYQMGPSLNALNQSASTGTLSLVPWTATALNQPGFSTRGIGFTSSLGVSQLSAAAAGKFPGSSGASPRASGDGSNIAVLAGYSSGTVFGPSASAGARWNRGEYTGSIHFLATDLDAQTLGPIDFPTPLARTHNTRFIPMLQNDFRLSKSSLLKTSLFYDWGYLGYLDPGSSNQSQYYFKQWGAENVCLVNQWKLGVSGRQVQFNSASSYIQNNLPTASTVDLPLQNIGNLQISREIDFGNISIEPTLQGIWMTDYGFIPEGSLGARADSEDGTGGIFGRASFSKRAPSILDRYSMSYDFLGNPNLKMETDWTGILGGEWKGKKAEASLQGYTQLKQNARVSIYNAASNLTVINLNDAYVLAATGTGTFHLTRHFDLFDSGTVSKSRLLVTGYEFPYIPTFLNIAGINLHEAREKRRWEWSTMTRISSSQVVNAVTGERVPGYLTLDTGLQFNLTDGLRLAGRVEDLLDRSYELIKGYPIGRTFSVMLAGEL